MKKEEIVMGLYAMRLQGKNRVAQERNNTVDRAVELINQLDEPEKTLIPQFVADWIEEERVKIIDWHTEIPERFFLILGHKLHYTTLASTNIADWIFGGNEEKLYQALKYGYEVEKEKKYYIYDKSTKGYLGYNTDKTRLSWYTSQFPNDVFTEQEIKSIDERYWAFAEEVKE